MKIPCILAALLIVACSENIISIPSGLVKEKPAQYTLYMAYWLPKTALKIQVPITYNEPKPSIVNSNDAVSINKLLLEYFNWEPVTSAGKDIYAIDQKIVIQPVTLRDPAKKFVLAYKKSKAIAKTLNVSMSKDGLIQSGEFAQESKVYDVVKKSVELLAAGIGALALNKEQNNFTKSIDTALNSITDKRVSTLIRQAIRLSDARIELIANPPTGVSSPEILKAHLSAIDEQLKSIKALLTGSVTKKIYYITIYLEPNQDFTEIPIVTLNPRSGIVSKPDDVWSRLSPELIKGSTDGAKVLKLVGRNLFNEKVTPGKAVDPKTVRRDTINHSAFLYYNVPAKYELTLLYGSERIASYGSKDSKDGIDDYQVYFPQLGNLAYLPSDFKEANVIYYEDTGGLKSAKQVTTATATAEQVEGMYKALDSLRATIKAATASDKKEAEEDAEKVEEEVIRLIIQSDTTSTH